MPAVSVLRRKDRGTWYVEWRDSAGRHRVHRPTRAAADDLAATVRSDLLCGTTTPTNATWSHVIEAYCYAMAPRSPAHQREINRTLGSFDASARPARMADVTLLALRTYINARLESGISAHTVDKDRRNLRAFLNWCVHNSYIRANPLDHLERMPLPIRIVRAPRPEEWVRLLRAIPSVPLDDPQGWHLMILLAAVTGVRATPLLRIEASDVDIAHVARDGAGLLRVVSKRDVESYHGLPPLVCRRLARRIAALPAGTTRIFRWSCWPRKAWQRLCAAAQFSFTFHSLRAAAATRRAEAMAVSAAQGALGHTDQRTTRTSYLELVRIQLAIARGLDLPRLPVLPAYRLYVLAPNRPPRPAGNG